MLVESQEYILCDIFVNLRVRMRVEVVRESHLLHTIRPDLVIPERDVLRSYALINRPQSSRSAMHVTAGHHRDAVANHTVISSKDVSRHVHPGDMPEMRFTVDVGPGYADEDVFGQVEARLTPLLIANRL